MFPESAGSRAEPEFKDALIRSQLEKILRSDLFVRSERLSRFLRFVVERSLDGLGDSLKEQVLACELYGRGAEFDTAADPVVRVDARRLRDKLREYYSENSDDTVVISLPKGSYRPVFELNSPAPPPAVIEFPTKASPRRWVIAAAIPVAIIAAAAAWLGVRSARNPEPRVVPLSSLPGNEGPPALSPDGNFVAFSWSDPKKPGPPDIWIKAVDNEDLRRLTDTPLDGEGSPAWSPDGREIAFVRGRQGVPQGVFIASVLGTTERKVSDSGTHVGWAADSKSILIRDREFAGQPYAIFQIALETREKRRLTQPSTGIGDWTFEVSPDGDSLAWIRYGRPGIGDIYVTSLRGGEPRRLTDWAVSIEGLAWTPDSREIVFGVERGGPRRLFRIAANGTRPGRGSLIQGIHTDADLPSMSRRDQRDGVRLAFRTLSLDIDLQMMDLASPRDAGTIRAQAFSPSTRVEGSARFSPDGNRIAFISYRSGEGEIWLAGRDGSGLRRLTDLGALETVVSSWSPDGSEIAFTATVNGNTDIYTVAIDGGRPRRLTTDPSTELLPSHSADGRWIYFTRVLGVDIRAWRIPASGGQASQVTDRGGLQPQESPDGQDLFYLDESRPRSSAPSNLMKMPVGGGAEVIILENVMALTWSVTDKGILLVNREPGGDAVDFYRFADQTVTRVGRLDFRLPGIISHMTFSRDGTRALGTRMVRNDSDLMLIDGFR